jgi:hypothetical protein
MRLRSSISLKLQALGLGLMQWTFLDTPKIRLI